MPKKSLLIAVVALLLGACTERPVGAAVTDTPRVGWSDAVEVRYESGDTLSLFAVGFVVRQEAGHSEGVVPLRVVATAPSGVSVEGAVVLTPSDKHRGGSFVELSARWVEDARFGEVGDYRFSIAPQQPTDGVWSVGVRVEKKSNE